MSVTEKGAHLDANSYIMSTVTNKFNKNKLVKNFSLISLSFPSHSHDEIILCVATSLPSIQFTNYTSFIKHFYYSFFGHCLDEKWFSLVFLPFGNLFMTEKAFPILGALFGEFKSFSIIFMLHI